jgi:sugar phosphate permease
LLSGLKSGVLVNSVFIFLMLMNGILCGAAFPVLGFLTSKWKRGRPGAWIYAFDLIGAGVGAFFIAPFLIPAAGMQNTLIILALLISSLVILVLCLLRLVTLCASPRGQGVENLENK